MEMSRADFDRMVVTKIKDEAQAKRAGRVFEDYGPNLAFDVFNVMLHAVGLEKVDEVLEVLEGHWIDHLSFQHPEIRGTVSGIGGNPTQAMFVGICRDTLKLAMNTQEAGS